MDWQPEEPIGPDTLRKYLATEVPLCRNPASRFSYIRQGADALLLFVDGQCFDCAEDTAPLAEMLCAQDRITISQELRESEPAVTLLTALFNQGSIAFEPAD